jgi:molybdopterin-guanine dinucleotide biosynthesis protein B
MVPVISFVGTSGSGKTTLLERLIAELTARGVVVGTIKHHAHSTEFDTPGKDTYRHRKAGARVTVLACPSQVVSIEDTAIEATLAEVAARFAGRCDLVLTEGYKRSDAPKVEVFRDALRGLLCGPGDNLIALATDLDVDAGVPRFPLDDPRPLADFLVARFLTAAGR